MKCFFGRAALVAPMIFVGACVSTPELQAKPDSSVSSGSVAAKTNGKVQRGHASYYRHGRKTANGEPFNPGGMTAAHRTLPFGTKVRVVHEGTGREVVVRINDRGPFIRGRVIDLAQGAAQKLGLMASGTAPVAIYSIN